MFSYFHDLKNLQFKNHCNSTQSVEILSWGSHFEEDIITLFYFCKNFLIKQCCWFLLASRLWKLNRGNPKGFPGGSDGKEPACNAGDLGWSLGWEDPLAKGMTIL